MYEYVNGFKVFVMIGKGKFKKNLKMVNVETGGEIVVPAGTVVNRFSRNEKTHIFVYTDEDGTRYEYRNGYRFLPHGIGWAKILMNSRNKWK